MRRHEYAALVLQQLFHQVGPPKARSLEELNKLEDQLATGLLPGSFQFTIHLYDRPKITRPIQLHQHLHINEISYEDYFDLIHDQWWKLYLFFGIAAYRVSEKYRDELLDQHATNQIKVPLRINGGPDYVWYNQVSIPAAFDEYGRMAAHINIYQLDRHYDVNHLVTGPLTVFGKEIRLEIGREIQAIAQKLFYAEYIDKTPEKRKKKLPYLTKSQARVLYLYRKLAFRERHDTVTSETVAAASEHLWPGSGFSQASVMAHARDIRQFFNANAVNDTPLSAYNFASLREMA
ncbi:MAG: hypothetical protein AAFQ01_05575, partial [Bacteroidota bacterium]